MVTLFPAIGSPEITVTEDQAWTLDFAPRATWMPGSPIVGGKLTVTGTWNVKANEHDAPGSLETLTALIIHPDCATRITGGRIAGLYSDANGDVAITVSWSDCGKRTYGASSGFAF